MTEENNLDLDSDSQRSIALSASKTARPGGISA